MDDETAWSSDRNSGTARSVVRRDTDSGAKDRDSTHL